MTPAPELEMRLRRLRLGGPVAAVVGGVACAAGWSISPERFYAAWLMAFFYWVGISLGCLAVAMLHGISGGAWGRAIRRVLEAGYQTIPVLALAFVPLWLAVAQVYVWADPAVVRQHESLARKAAYLNVGGFQARSIVYFAVWLGITWVLGRVSPNDEPRLESPRSLSLQRRSGLCCVAYGVTMTLAAVDWGMSLEPEWYSTMYALIHIAGQAVSGLAFALVVVAALADCEPWSRIVTPQRLNDLGNLLLASVMFWAYCSFFQYLVIWSGNLPEENVWYVHRSRDGWQYLAMGLMALHFIVPFLLLLSRQLKRQKADLARIAALLLAMRYADLYWLIVPGFQRDSAGPRGLAFHWLDAAALAAIGGAWLAVFAWRLPARVQMPMFDPVETEGADEQSSHTAVA
jgi:hypothetical protein